MKQWRSDFPQLQGPSPVIYFDSAATALKPQVVIDALDRFYGHEYGTIHRAVYHWAQHATECYNQTREKTRQLLNASHSDEILFTKGTTEAINLVANSFGRAFVQPGDEIIISQLEHHSNIVPWQILCQERGANLKVIPANQRGELLLETYAQLLSQRTRLVAVSQIANSIGTLHPIQEMAAMAKSVGAYFLVDAAQSVPRMTIDLQQLGVDFLVFSGHKLYGPTGVGILYGRKELLEQMPPYQTGGSMIERVTFEKTTFAALPQKFEAGTPMIGAVIALGSAIDYVRQIGLETICQHERLLLDAARQMLLEIPGVRIIGDAAHKAGILSFVVEGLHPLDIGTLLDLKGVAVRTGHHCAQPAMEHFGVTATLRISFGLYNTLEEVALFGAKLRQVLDLLR